LPGRRLRSNLPRGDIKPGSSGFQQDGHAINDRRDMRPRPAHPVGQNGAVDRKAVPGHDPRLAVQRHVFGMFCHGDMGKHCFGWPTALKQMRWGLGLRHACAPLGTGVFGPDGDNDPILGRNHIDPFGPVLSDPHHITTAAGTGNAVGFNHTLDTGQVLGQRP